MLLIGGCRGPRRGLCAAWFLVVRACADTRARAHKDAGGSDGARTRVDRPAQVRMTDGCAHTTPVQNFIMLNLAFLRSLRNAGVSTSTEARLAEDLNGLDSKPRRNRIEAEGTRSIPPRPPFFNHRDLRMTPNYIISDKSRWREYCASGVGCY